MASPNILTPTEHQKQLRRAVIASMVGTAIEWYDFFLYSTVTGLVFAKLFFPHSAPWVGTLQAFGIYAVGFVARPVGALIFGHYGDRIGRKSTLIVTLLLMGVGYLRRCARSELRVNRPLGRRHSHRLWDVLCGGNLYSGLLGSDLGRDGAYDGLHGQGHQRGVRSTISDLIAARTRDADSLRFPNARI
jgi:Sugar (and other) transporter